MILVSDNKFQELINDCLQEMSGPHLTAIKNIAILYEEIPTKEQRHKLALRNDQTLLGLYEGVPLTLRQGQTPILPDKITLFKAPMQIRALTINELREDIKHTLWHELAHYYGLNHDQISQLESGANT